VVYLKKLMLFTLFILLYLLTPLIVSAQAVNISSSILLNALLSTGGELKLIDDITLTSNSTVNNDTVLDLNGHVINTDGYSITAYGKLTIIDSSSEQTGKITGNSTYIIKIGDSINEGNLVLKSGNIDCSHKNYCVRAYNKGNLIIDGGKITGSYYPVIGGNITINDGLIEANKSVIYGNTNSLITINGGVVRTLTDHFGVSLSKPGSKLVMNGGKIEALYEDGEKGVGIGAFKDTEIIINDGEVVGSGAAIMGNGSVSGTNEGTNLKITINGGTITSTDGLAIYAPQPNGNTIITGGNITGKTTAIEIRAGKLTITGGTLKGGTDSYEVIGNGNGSNTIGSSIAIVQHTTKLPIEVNISGGTFVGNVPISESNPMNNSREDLNKISLNITGGIFNASGSKALDLADLSGDLITGGTFTNDVSEFVNEDTHYIKPNNDSTFTVLPYQNIIYENEEYKDIVHIDKALPGEVSTISKQDKEDYDTIVTIKDKDGNIINVSDNKFIMPDGGITVSVTYSFLYKFLSGENQTFKKDDIVIKTNGDINKLLRIDVNGKELDKSQYSIKEGSTILVLSKSYLSNLSSGTYSIDFVYNDGNLSTTFIIPKSSNIINPKTSDNINIYKTIFVISLFGIISSVVLLKKIK